MTTELKPCPCCGTSSPELHLDQRQMGPLGECRAKYVCDNPDCGMQTRWEKSLTGHGKGATARAAASWNRRSGPQPEPRPKPKPKYKMGQRVFAEPISMWGIIKKVTYVGDDEKYLYHVATRNCGNSFQECNLITAPTWLEEFGDDDEGRKKLIMQLLGDNQKVELYHHAYPPSWEESANEIGDFLRNIYNNYWPVPIEHYRFAPEA